MNWHKEWDTRLRKWLPTIQEGSSGVRHSWKGTLLAIHDNNSTETGQKRHFVRIVDRTHSLNDTIVTINAFEGHMAFHVHQSARYLMVGGNQLLSDFMLEFADISRLSHSSLRTWLANRVVKRDNLKSTV